MTGRERVKKAVLFQCPDRIPRSLPGDWGTDFLGTWVGLDPKWAPKVEGEDEFGCVWEKLAGDKTMGQVRNHPLADYSLLGNWQWPDYSVDARYDDVRKAVQNNPDARFIICGTNISLWHRLEYMRGSEFAYTDPYEHPEELGKFLDRLADTAIIAIRKMGKEGVDGFIIVDDWGWQDRPMISPELFRKFFKPRYARIFGAAHESGLLTFQHSCGYIMPLLDDFIEAGLNVIQMDQQENMGVEELSRRFGGRICFWCPVDIQQTMIKGSVQDVEKYARRLISELGKFNGGFMATWYSAPDAAGHTQEKIDAMCRAFCGKC